MTRAQDPETGRYLTYWERNERGLDPGWINCATASAKADIVEDIASMIITELQNQGLTDAICGDLEKHAYSVNDRISSTQLRTMHIMAGV